MVDGKLSQWAYLSSVDTCYERYCAKYAAKHPKASAVTVDHFDYFAFHSPYNKLVQKGFARFLYVDSIAAKDKDDAMYSEVRCFKDMSVQDTYESRDLEAAYRTLSNSRYCTAL
jgi:hydroxymethylglutaryl-CoA synthase